MSSNTQQHRLFDFETPTGEATKQGRLWNDSPAIEQWYRVFNQITRLNYESQRENAVGFWGELITHTFLWQLAVVGGLIEYQKTLGKDTRADFFISGLSRYPKGFAIETRVQTGTGSHDSKIPTAMLNYRLLGYPAMVLILGKVVSNKNQRIMTSLQGADVFSCGLDDMLDWVLMTRKAQQL